MWPQLQHKVNVRALGGLPDSLSGPGRTVVWSWRGAHNPSSLGASTSHAGDPPSWWAVVLGCAHSQGSSLFRMGWNRTRTTLRTLATVPALTRRAAWRARPGAPRSQVCSPPPSASWGRSGYQ